MKNLALKRSNLVKETDKDRTNKMTMMTFNLKLLLMLLPKLFRDKQHRHLQDSNCNSPPNNSSREYLVSKSKV